MTKGNPSIAVIIVAAGSGERFGGDIPKQWRPLAGQTLVERSVRSLQRDALTHAGQKTYPDWISLVVSLAHRKFQHEIPNAHITMTIVGGPDRQTSVYYALKMIPKDFELIAIHDAVRPFWPLNKWDALIDACSDHDGAILAAQAGDTLKRVQGGMTQTVDRTGFWNAQTPQVFNAERLKSAHVSALRAGFLATDDAELIERAGGNVAIVPSSRTNIKITTPDDWTLAEHIAGLSVPSLPMRVGIGYDTHRLGGDGPLVLGGVQLADTGGLIGHSDGDALLHAICDALLGAAALGDIGQHFPPGDPRYAGVNSRLLLRETVAILARAKYRPIQVDATVLAEQPRIMPHADSMRHAIAADLGIDHTMVSVKATTNEQMGFIGRGEGIAAQAICTVAPLGS